MLFRFVIFVWEPPDLCSRANLHILDNTPCMERFKAIKDSSFADWDFVGDHPSCENWRLGAPEDA
ncbi:hypothetical protein GCM10009000_067770 [Halobacterium noricense]